MEEEFTHQDIHFFDTLESTNLYAQELIKSKKVVTNCIIAAKYQTAGKGQRGSSWLSNYAENLLFSVILFPTNLHVSNVFYLSKITSLALHDFISGMTEGQVRIKWPNDLFVNKRKIAGILIENNISGNKILSSVIGIGLNVNQKLFGDIDCATSLSIENGVQYELTELLTEFAKCFSSWSSAFNESDKKSIDASYLDALYALGETKCYRDKEGNFQGKILGVDEYGRLHLRKETGECDFYDIKEIQFIT